MKSALAFWFRRVYNRLRRGDVAQLVRALCSHRRGLGFEPQHPYQTNKAPNREPYLFGQNKRRGSKPAKKATVLRFLRGRVFREEREGGDVSQLRDSIHEKLAPTSRMICRGSKGEQKSKGVAFSRGRVLCGAKLRSAERK